MTPKEQELIQLAQWLNNPWVALGVAVLAIWTIAWKGVALWKAAESQSKPWFVVLLLVNTVGILEIIYVFYFSKKKNNN